MYSVDDVKTTIFFSINEFICPIFTFNSNQMKNNFLILLTVFITGTIFTQTSFLVVNEDKIPVDGVQIFHKKKLIGNTSKGGKFSIKNMPLGDTVFFKVNEISEIHVISENTRKTTQTITLHSPMIEVLQPNDDYFSPPEMVTMAEEHIYLDVDEMALFPGGREELDKYLAKNLKYPENAIKNEIEGKYYLRFVVEKNGEITNVKITRSVQHCPECDNEAKRVVRSFPKFKPAKLNGAVVRSYYVVPVIFKLD